MSTSTIVQPPAAEPTLELSQAMQLLSGISESLSTSYARLADHARRVEDELVVANGALAAKVAELDALRAHLEGILQALPMGVVVRDADGRIVRANAAACAILEASPAELRGAREHALLAGTRADGSNREVFKKDGRRAIVAERSSPITGQDGRAGASVQVLDDRTELVELTERVHKLDKMAALGTMAGGIAHEIRNPMNAMLGFAELLKRELPQHSRGHRYASRISDGVAEADAIISSMLTLAAPERLVLETLDAKTLVDEALELARRSIPSSRDAALWTLENAVPTTSFAGDRVKLRQALRNLVANALQAQKEGGLVRVALERADGALLFHVTDHGPGIPADVRRRLGDPFFTTRAEGTGLGLSLVHTIAELHGGRFQVCPHPTTCPHGDGRGAHVVFRIPQLHTEKQ
ncbi:MAG: ATP-binding protein [Planctomycetota bacterium]